MAEGGSTDMADGPNKLVTEFITTADPKGAQQTAEAIKGVKAAAAEAAPAQDELNKKGKEGAESTKELAKEKKNLTDTLKVLRTEFPLLARAIDFVRNPITVVATAVTVLVSAFKAMRDESRRAAEAAEDSVRGADRIASGLGRMRDLAAQMAQTEEGFRRTLKTIEEGAGAAGKALEGMNKEIERQKRFADEQEDAQLAVELEEIDAAEAGGGMSRPQAIRARGAARERSRGRRAATAADAREQQLQALGATRFATEGEASQMELELEAAREAVLEAKKLERVEERSAAETIKAASKLIAEAQAANERNQQEVAHAQERAKELGTHPHAAAELRRAEAGMRAIDSNAALIEAKDREIDVANERLEKRRGATAAAQGRVGELEGGIRGRRTAIEGMRTRMDDLRAEGAMEESLGPARGQVAGVARAQANREAGSAAAAEARQWFEMYEELNRAIIEVLRRASGSAEATRAEVERVRAEFDAKVNRTNAQVRNGRE